MPFPALTVLMPESVGVLWLECCADFKPQSQPVKFVVGILGLALGLLLAQLLLNVFKMESYGESV